MGGNWFRATRPTPRSRRRFGLTEGDFVQVRSRRGHVETRARITDIRAGVVFVPLHYGPWRSIHDASQEPTHRAANELTINVWDPVSKQPLFKVAAVHIDKTATGDGSPSSAPTVGAPRPVDGTTVTPTAGGTAAMASSTVDDGRD